VTPALTSSPTVLAAWLVRLEALAGRCAKEVAAVAAIVGVGDIVSFNCIVGVELAEAIPEFSLQ